MARAAWVVVQGRGADGHVCMHSQEAEANAGSQLTIASFYFA